MVKTYTEEEKREYLLCAISTFTSWFFSYFIEFWNQPGYLRAKDAIGLHIEDYKAKSKSKSNKAKDQEEIDLDSGSLSLFSLLPTEIRLQIWEAAVPGPRAVILRSPLTKTWKERLTLQKNKKMRCRQTSWWTSTPVPTILHVNRESRRVGLKYYQLGLASGMTRPAIYINFGVDWVMLGRDEMRPECAALWARMHDVEKIRGLIVSYSGFEGFLGGLGGFDVARRFLGLENVFIVRSMHLEHRRLPPAAIKDLGEWVVDRFENFGIAWLRLRRREMRLELHWTNAKRQRSMACFELLPNGDIDGGPMMISPRPLIVTP